MPISSFLDFVLTRIAGICPGRGVEAREPPAFEEAVGREVGVEGLDGPEFAAEGLAPFPAAPTEPGRPAARILPDDSLRFLLKAHGWTAEIGRASCRERV